MGAAVVPMSAARPLHLCSEGTVTPFSLSYVTDDDGGFAPLGPERVAAEPYRVRNFVLKGADS